jgi:hypothetical protein
MMTYDETLTSAKTPDSYPVGKVVCLLLAFVLALDFAIQADAKTVYVSTTGHDTASGTSSEPVLTPARAISLALPGDTVILRGGTYTVSHYIWIDKPNLTVESYPGELAKIVGGTSDEHSLTSIFITDADHVSLVGLDIQGGSYYGVKFDLADGRPSRGCSVRGCHIHDTGCDCLKSYESDQLLIEDCDIGPSGVRDPSDAEGIDSVASVGVTIRRCHIHDTATNGLYLKGGARDGLIEGCRIENTSGYGGILLGQDTDLEFMRDGAKYEAINCVARNNIIVHTGAAGLGTYSGKDIRFENNTLYNVAETCQAAFWVVTNSRNVPPEHITFLNNIVAMAVARPMVYVQNPIDKLTCDYNLYYSKLGRYDFTLEITLGRQTFNRWDFGNWKREMQVDLHSKLADPLLSVADVYRPRAESPALGGGVFLPDVVKDYSGANRPEGRPYDIGAYQR